MTAQVAQLTGGRSWARSHASSPALRPVIPNDAQGQGPGALLPSPAAAAAALATAGILSLTTFK